MKNKLNSAFQNMLKAEFFVTKLIKINLSAKKYKNIRAALTVAGLNVILENSI